MRIEDLSLSAFVAGTAIGYLIWYWTRSGGKVTELSKTQFHFRIFLICAIALMALSIGYAVNAVEPIRSAQLFLGSHRGLAALITALIVIVVLLYLRRYRGSKEAYTRLFQTTLAVVSCFILAMIVVLLIWGPHSLYLHTADRWIAAMPLGALLLGVLFGGVGAEWIDYIIDPNRLSTDTLKSQHTRWGFVLLTLLVLGIIYPTLPRLIERFTSANVTTPLGTISFSSQPISTIREPHGGQRLGEETSNTRLWDAFKDFTQMAMRDKQYAHLFYRNKPSKLAAVDQLHAAAAGFVGKVLSPLGDCR